MKTPIAVLAITVLALSSGCTGAVKTATAANGNGHIAASPSLGQNSINLTGYWRVEMSHGGYNSADSAFELRQEGKTVRGYFYGGIYAPGPTQAVEGVLEGNVLTFTTGSYYVVDSGGKEMEGFTNRMWRVRATRAER